MKLHVAVIQFHTLSFIVAGSEEFFDPPDRETMRLQKFGKLLAGPNTDLGEREKKKKERNKKKKEIAHFYALTYLSSLPCSLDFVMNNKIVNLSLNTSQREAM